MPKSQIRHSSWLTEWGNKEEAMLLETDHFQLMKWTRHIMEYYCNLQMTQEFTRCFLMLMGRRIRNNKCSIKHELVDLPILRTHRKVLNKIKLKWEIPCTMATSWKTFVRAMLVNNRYLRITSILNNIMVVNTSKINKTLPVPVIEMEPAHLVLIQVGLEATELERQMEFRRIIKLTYST